MTKYIYIIAYVQNKTVWITHKHTLLYYYIIRVMIPDSKVHGVNMGPTWVLSAPDGPHVGPMNLVIRDISCFIQHCVSTDMTAWTNLLVCILLPYRLPMRQCNLPLFQTELAMEILQLCTKASIRFFSFMEWYNVMHFFLISDCL